MDSQRLKKRGQDSSPLQVPSTAKRHADKLSSVSTKAIKTEKEDIVPMAESEPNSLTWLSLHQHLDSFELNASIPMAQNVVPFPSNSGESQAKPDLPNPPRLLSRLRSPGLDKNHPADVVRRSYALVAKSLRETLVAKLTSDHEGLDLDCVIDLANAAFESLGTLEGESPELYRAVSDLIALRHELSETEKELKINGHRRNGFIAQSREASIALTSAKASLDKARKAVSEKKDLINKLEDEIGNLEARCNTLEIACMDEAIKQQDARKQIEEERKNAWRIYGRRDEALAGIERTKALLASMLA